MPPPVRKGPLAACAVFVALGIVLIATGERVVGLMSVLFFGLGGLALLLPLMPRSDGAVRIIDVGGERAFLFPYGRARRLVVIVAAIGLTAASVLLLILGNAIIGTIGVVVFGGLTVYAALTWGRAHGLALTPTRVALRGAGGGELPWEAVAAVGFLEYARTRQIGIDATDPALVRRSRLGRLNASLLPVALLVPVDHLATPPEQTLATLVAYLEEPRRRAAIGTEAELARLR
jgi:hypothetical protein